MRKTASIIILFLILTVGVFADEYKDFQPIELDFQHIEEVKENEPFKIMKSKLSIKMQLPKEGIVTKKYNMVGENPTIVDTTVNINGKDVKMKDIFVARIKAKNGKQAEFHILFSEKLTAEGFAKPYIVYKDKKILGPNYYFTSYFTDLKADEDKKPAEDIKLVEEKVPEKEEEVTDKNDSKFEMYLLGKKLNYDKNSGIPYINGGRTMVPVRLISENLDYKVSWDEKNKVVLITNPLVSNSEIKMQIGNNIAEVNGNKTVIDPKVNFVAPEITGGRTFVPLRFVTESMGLKIDYTNKDGTHIIKMYQ